MLAALRPLALSVYLPTLVLSVCSGLLLPVLPVYATTFSTVYTVVGLILAGEAIGMLLGNLPAGMLLRYLGRKQAMGLGIVLVGASTLALVWTASLWGVLGLRLLAGAGAALWNLSRHAYLTEATRSAERGRAIALFGGVHRVGLFLGPALGGVIATRWGFEGAFLSYALLAGVALLVVLLFTEAAQAPAPSLHTPRSRWLNLISEHRRALTVAGGGQLLAQMIRSSRQVIIPLYGAHILGLELATIGLIMSLSALVDMSMFYPAGLLMDRWGRKYAIVPCFLIQGLAMALVPITTSALTLLLCAAVIGFGNGLGSGTMMTLGSDLAPPDKIGEFLGVWRLIGDGGATGAPLAVGAIADALSLPAAALVMAGVGVAAAAVFAFGVPETLRRERPA
ncbi:MAG: MFS transporter [Truepera sp.]|nr:MFS transporter [Truepera sp.]